MPLGAGVLHLDGKRGVLCLEPCAERLNDSLAHHERLDAILVEDEPWTIEAGLLTPTLKIKRHRVEQRYAACAEALRGGHVHWRDEVSGGH